MEEENNQIDKQQFEPILCSKHKEPIESINIDQKNVAKLVCSKCEKNGKFILSIKEAEMQLSKLSAAHIQYEQFGKLIKSMLDTLNQFKEPCLQIVEKLNKLAVECTTNLELLTSNPPLKTMVDTLTNKNYKRDTLEEIANILSKLSKIDENYVERQSEMKNQIQDFLKQTSDLAFKNKLGVDINFSSNVTQEQYLDISNDHKLIAFSQILKSDIIELFNVEAQTLIFKYYTNDEVTYLKFSPNSKYLAAALKTSFDIIIYNVRKLNLSQPIRRLKGHKNILYSMIIPENSTTIFSGGLDHNLILWNFQQNKKIFKKKFNKIILGIEISVDQKYYLVHSFQQITIFSAQAQQEALVLDAAESTYLVRFGMDSQQLIIFQNVDQLELYNINDCHGQKLGNSLWKIELKYSICRQMLRIIGTILISYGESIKLWDMSSGQLILERDMPKVPQNNFSYEIKCYQDLQLYAVTTDMKQITKQMEIQENQHKINWCENLELVDLFGPLKL